MKSILEQSPQQGVSHKVPDILLCGLRSSVSVHFRHGNNSQAQR